jgi:hypothetical protein
MKKNGGDEQFGVIICTNMEISQENFLCLSQLSKKCLISFLFSSTESENKRQNRAGVGTSGRGGDGERG